MREKETLPSFSKEYNPLTRNHTQTLSLFSDLYCTKVGLLSTFPCIKTEIHFSMIYDLKKTEPCMKSLAFTRRAVIVESETHHFL